MSAAEGQEYATHNDRTPNQGDILDVERSPATTGIVVVQIPHLVPLPRSLARPEYRDIPRERIAAIVPELRDSSVADLRIELERRGPRCECHEASVMFMWSDT